MQAHVIESAHAAIRLPHDQHRLAADFGRDEVAGLAQVGFHGAEQPDFLPDALPLELHELGRGVAFLADQLVAQVRVRLLARRA